MLEIQLFCVSNTKLLCNTSDFHTFMHLFSIRISYVMFCFCFENCRLSQFILISLISGPSANFWSWQRTTLNLVPAARCVQMYCPVEYLNSLFVYKSCCSCRMQAACPDSSLSTMNSPTQDWPFWRCSLIQQTLNYILSCVYPWLWLNASVQIHLHASYISLIKGYYGMYVNKARNASRLPK